MKRFGPGICLALVIACNTKPVAARFTAADTQQIRDLVRAAQTKADAYAQARERGLREAWRTLDPAAGTAPCPVNLPKELDVAHWRMTVVAGSAVLGEPPPADEKMMQKIEREVATKGPRHDQFERQSTMLLHQVLNDDLKNQAYRAAIEAMKAVAAS